MIHGASSSKFSTSVRGTRYRRRAQKYLTIKLPIRHEDLCGTHVTHVRGVMPSFHHRSPCQPKKTTSSNFLDDVDRKDPNQPTTFDTIHTLTHHTLGSKSEAHCILDKAENISKGTFDQLIDSSFGVLYRHTQHATWVGR